MNWLLLFVPIAIGLELLAPDRHLLVTFTLVTHPALFAGSAAAEEEKHPYRWAGPYVCLPRPRCRCARDSPLEGEGFEPSVPPRRTAFFEAARNPANAKNHAEE
jgi:hypothetical protein